MSLNLDSLKNFATVPVVPTTTIDAKNNVAGPVQGNQTPTPDVIHADKIQTLGPKISLLKLKKESGIANPLAPETDESVDNSDQEKELSSSISQVIKVEEGNDAIIPNEVIVTKPSIVIHSNQEEKKTSEVSQSIILDSVNSDSLNTDDKILTIQDNKEFFPKFQITTKLSFNEELLDLQDLMTIEEKQAAPTIGKDEIKELTKKIQVISTSINNASDGEKTDVIIQKGEEVVSKESANNEVNKEPSSNTVNKEVSNNEVSTEHVAEVKTELSEQRKAGFRFFVQKKKKIIAGISITILSISAIALFSGSFLSPDIQKSGKTNLQEVKQQIEIPPVEPSVDPEVKITPTNTSRDYELGVDYSVSKNTKKNLRTKVKIDTSAEINTPTP